MTGERLPTVLLVDDVPDNIAILADILKEGYRLKAARDGESALKVALGDPPPDLILLDVAMPGMDGLEVCRRLKRDERGSRIPVIFVTARDDESDESRGFEAGCVDYILKPVTPSLVRARVSTHLELKRQADILRENERLREEVEAISRHDLKSPLMVVLNVPGLILADAELSENHRKLLRMVEEAGRRMLERVNRTIDLFRMEKGTYVPTPARVDVLRLVGQVIASSASLLAARRITCRVLLNGMPPADGALFEVRGEELLLYSMLANLFKNAAEASPQGGEVRIALQGPAPSVSVHNAGAVPREIRGRFFEKFATSGKPRGTGLGTYSARLIARTLGGDIEMASDDASGTTVTVRLPPAGEGP